MRFSTPDEFYVGYLPVMPRMTRLFLKKTVIAIFLVMALICGLIVLNQRMFTTNNFEYGIPSKLEGVIYTEPVPRLVINLGVDQHGNKIFKTILLVGYGKSGADQAIQSIEAKLGRSIVGKRIALNGYLIYGDGKALLQISGDENSNPLIAENTETQSKLIEIGEVIVFGEVIDPKCYFGVMKPGEGKPHRSCAIRCLAGGIPPVFHVGTSSEYYFLLGEDFQPINDQVLSLVGDQVKLEGKVMRMHEWKVLVVKRDKLMSLAKAKELRQNLLAMNEGITVCGVHQAY